MSELALKLIKEAKEKRLTRLDLGNCGLTELPDELFELTWLESLTFESQKVSKSNKLTFINQNIGELKNLRYLNLSESLYQKSLSYDFNNLKLLKNLEELYITRTHITDLSFLRHLTYLKTLDLRWNHITDITELSKLNNLERLKLYCNKIKDLNPLSGLLNLKYLSIDDNLVEDLKPIIELIKRLPVSLKDYDFNNKIYVNKCPLINPPIHIVEKGSEAILRHWQELENKETITNNQTKLIFVGNSRTGKTSLWQFLKDKIYNDQADSTHGIKTEIWDSETLGTEDKQNLAAHIWDFGGQEYYHATHRLFLADNAVYVLVWERDSNKQGTRLEKFKLDNDPNGEIEEVDLEHFPASYWLENIQYFGGKHCPVLIVQNKVDEETLKANYTEGGKNLPDCFHLSVKNAFAFQQGHQDFEESNMDFQKFKLRLLKELRKNATAFKLVKYYAQVREALEAKAKDTEYIAVSELEDIALQFDETPDLDNLLAYLKSFTNTVLYFPQNDVLKDRLYLNPTHISRDIYKILNKTVRENNGKFNITHIQKRLNCDALEAERFVALMIEFDLIFEKSKIIKGENSRQFITPQYLPKYEDLDDTVHFLIEGYEFKTSLFIKFKSFVPRSMMLRFIAQNGAYANQETYWRNGIIYKSAFSQKMIQVKYDHEKSTFSVSAQGTDMQGTDMQNIVTQFVKLNGSDDKIEISNDGNAYFELRKIQEAHHQNRIEINNFEGQYTPLSNFDWLTQKHKTKEFMTLNELKDKVRALISNAKTKDAMNEIVAWAHEQNQEQLKNDIALLKGDWSDLNRDKTLGLLGSSEANIRQNQLANKVLNLLDLIEIDKVTLENNNSKDIMDWEIEILKYLATKPITTFHLTSSFAHQNNLKIDEINEIADYLIKRGLVEIANSFHLGGPDRLIKITYEGRKHLKNLDKSLIENPKIETNTVLEHKSKIYFSYAWGDEHETGESREKLVGELYESLKNDGYDVRRDKENVRYKESISDFMKEIGHSGFIITVLSDKYLKSANCMFEFLQIYRKSNSDLSEFKDKIYPIVLEGTKIYDPIDRLKYVRYWKDKKEELEEEIKEIGLAETIAIIGNDYKNYKEIMDNIALIASLISDLNTLNPKLLSKNNFEEIKKTIISKINV